MNSYSFILFFSIRVFFHRHWLFTGQQGKTIFYSNLPLPLAHKHSDIYLQLCIWDEYQVFLIASLVFTRQLLNEIYRLIELPFDWLMMQWYFSCLFTWWFNSMFLLQQFEKGMQRIWTRIDYRPCITSKQTNQKW